MDLVSQKAWAESLRKRKSSSTYLIPSYEPQIKKEERMISTSVGDSRVLVYEPIKNESYSRPVFINLHGGGFVKGDAEHDDKWCAVIAERAQCVVINVDYRLAPEHKFPKALYEVYDIAHWVYSHSAEWNIDPKRIAIGGHSAGGNLATATCLLNKERGNKIPFIYQILDYPPLDIHTDPTMKPRFKDEIPISTARLFTACYVTEKEQTKNPLISPVFAESLEGMPDALIITAERDSLAKEAEIYAEKLKEAGVKVRYKQFEGVSHGFNFTGEDLTIAEESWYLMSDELKKVFERK